MDKGERETEELGGKARLITQGFLGQGGETQEALLYGFIEQLRADRELLELKWGRLRGTAKRLLEAADVISQDTTIDKARDEFYEAKEATRQVLAESTDAEGERMKQLRAVVVAASHATCVMEVETKAANWIVGACGRCWGCRLRSSAEEVLRQTGKLE